ncbi:MAG: metallophosphoesterase [Pseudobdellovibrio sp.]
MNKRIIFLCTVLSILSFNSCVSQLTQSNASDSRTPQSRNENLGVTSIDDPSIYAKVFVISDVHGMYDQVLSILKAGKVINNSNNWIAGKSLLIVDGDSIDKGPKSLEVLNLWIKLQTQSKNVGGNFIHVLGNHEAEFLADPSDDKKAKVLLAELNSQNLPVTDLTSMDSPHGLFLHNEPVAARVGRWLFCHSGFFPDMNWADFVAKADKVIGAQNYGSKFLIGNKSILESKDWEKSKSTYQPVIDRLDAMNLFGIVFGHQPGAFGIRGRSAAKVGGRLIKIDNGMPIEGGSYPGSLLVFTNPAQMNALSYPSIKIINPDQSSYDLVPDNL